jgi:hypothetical protein
MGRPGGGIPFWGGCIIVPGGGGPDLPICGGIPFWPGGGIGIPPDGLFGMPVAGGIMEPW